MGEGKCSRMCAPLKSPAQKIGFRFGPNSVGLGLKLRPKAQVGLNLRPESKV